MSTEYEQDKRNVLPTETDCGEEERTYAQGMSDEEIRETLLLLRQSADSIPEDLQQKEISETQFQKLTQMQEEADSENTDNDAEDLLYAEAIRLLNGSEEKNRQPDEPEKKAIKENAVKANPAKTNPAKTNAAKANAVKANVIKTNTAERISVCEEKTKNTKKRIQNSLFRQMVQIIIIPVCLLMILLSVVISVTSMNQIKEEVRQELTYSAVTLEQMFSRLYPGELKKINVSDDYYAICLGEHILNEDDSLIMDELKQKTGIEYTYFYQTTRILTTVRDEEDNRYVGSTVSDVISEKVFERGEDAFYSNAVIGGETYYAYYMPILDQTGSCVGMIAVAKPLHSVIQMQKKTMIPVVLFILAAFACIILISMMFARRLAEALGKVESFLNKVAVGNLSAGMDRDVLLRKDELGSMARSSVSMQKSIRELVEKDALTTLHNRRYGEKQLKLIRERAEKTGIPYAVAIADIDYFKKVNDTYGHEAGDMVLRSVAAILKKAMWGKGVAARWGGEEFLLIFEDTTMETAAERLEEIRATVESARIPYGEIIMSVTMSFGATSGNADMDMNRNLKQADDCLYRAKEEGRNRVMISE